MELVLLWFTTTTTFNPLPPARAGGVGWPRNANTNASAGKDRALRINSRRGPENAVGIMRQIFAPIRPKVKNPKRPPIPAEQENLNRKECKERMEPVIGWNCGEKFP